MQKDTHSHMHKRHNHKYTLRQNPHSEVRHTPNTYIVDTDTKHLSDTQAHMLLTYPGTKSCLQTHMHWTPTKTYRDTN